MKLWSQILGKHEIGKEDNFFDLGGNSLRAAELSVYMMNEFASHAGADTIRFIIHTHLAEYIDTRGAQYTTQSYIQEEISARDSDSARKNNHSDW